MSLTSNDLQVREVMHQVVNDPAYKAVSHVPLLSGHQLALIVFAYIGVLGGMALHAYWDVSLWIVYPVMIFSGYMGFTPLHDATHRAVSSHRGVNDLLGTLSGWILFPMSNTAGYRYLHMAHHRYVGDPDLDPDEPMVGIPTRYFPLGYVALLFPDLLWAHWMLFKAWKRTPARTRFSVLSMIVGNVLFHLAWFLSPWAGEYLILFFIPNRLSILWTAFAFAHTPHPEGLKWHDFPFQSTFRLKGAKLLMESLLGQDDHAMHHFLPHIPWYKYRKAWALANGAFLKQGVPVKSLFTKPDPQYKDRILAEAEAQTTGPLQARVASIETAATGIKTFVFEPALAQAELPSFDAGAHIDVQLPSGKRRSYSLVNPPFEVNRYQIAVKKETQGRGGSQEMHEQISVGDTLEISRPKNKFVLYEQAQKYLLLAGGIGITPLLSMAHRLTEQDKGFELHICARTQEEVPFQFELQNWTFAPNVEIHLDRAGKSSMDIEKVLATPDQDTLIYLCGPPDFTQWIKQSALALGWTPDQLKQESFGYQEEGLSPAREFQVVLQQRGTSFTVAPDQTIIDALHHHRIGVPYSCLQGTCGTCVTRVVEGEVEHRDVVLREEEKRANELMCLCVSRAKGEQIVLDL